MIPDLLSWELCQLLMTCFFCRGLRHQRLLFLDSVRTTPKKLISGDCYTILNLISSDLKLISTLYVDFYVGRQNSFFFHNQSSSRDNRLLTDHQNNSHRFVTVAVTNGWEVVLAMLSTKWSSRAACRSCLKSAIIGELSAHSAR